MIIILHDTPLNLSVGDKVKVRCDFYGWNYNTTVVEVFPDALYPYKTRDGLKWTTTGVWIDYGINYKSMFLCPPVTYILPVT